MKPITSQSAHKQQFIWLSLLLILILLLNFFNLLTPMRGLLEIVTAPLLKFNTNLVHNLMWPVYSWQHSSKAVQRIQDLERKYAFASAQLGELESLKRENQALRQMIENSDRKLERVVVTAPILSFSQPTLGVGSAAGIQPGSMVLSAETLLGLITSVSEHQSQVTLFTQQQSQPILVQTETGTQGLLRGDGRRVLLTEVPAEAELKLNERVVTLGQTGIQKDVFVGRIGSIQSQPAAATKTAVIEQFVSFYEAVLVEVK